MKAWRRGFDRHLKPKQHCANELPLTFVLYPQTFLDVMKCADIELLKVLWILNDDDVGSGERLVREKLPPVIDLDV